MEEIPKNALKAYGSLFDKGKKLVLPISKEFFVKILAGSKKTEYRKSVDFYHRLFSEKTLIKTLYLHYRKGIIMRCDVLSVDHYERPLALSQSKFITTDFCYGINVKNPQIVEIIEI